MRPTSNKWHLSKGYLITHRTPTVGLKSLKSGWNTDFLLFSRQSTYYLHLSFYFKMAKSHQQLTLLICLVCKVNHWTERPKGVGVSKFGIINSIKIRVAWFQFWTQKSIMHIQLLRGEAILYEADERSKPEFLTFAAFQQLFSRHLQHLTRRCITLTVHSGFSDLNIGCGL